MKHLVRFLTVLLLLLAGSAVARTQQELAQQLVAGADAQVGVTVHYEPAYRRIAYPGGDVPQEGGVCSDVIIRAYRYAGIDLQQRVHEDMERHFSAYPHAWGLAHPDANIDHRRVPNLAAFFKRHGASLPVSKNPGDYHPGDVVTWLLPGNLTHIGLVSDAKEGGVPLMLHNIGEGAQRENMLFTYPITGHYRYLPES